MKPYKQGVYALFNGDKLVFFGQSNCLYARIGQHIREDIKPFTSFELFPLDVDSMGLTTYESALIDYFRPPYNTALVGGKPPRHIRATKGGYVKAINRIIDHETKRLDGIYETQGGFVRCEDCVYNRGLYKTYKEQERANLIWSYTTPTNEPFCPMQAFIHRNCSIMDGCTMGERIERKQHDE